ncbi:MAG: hypothetical protein JWN34_1673 [Bryobacterales bacterium]|nr:hypothetical protein [Bryobacterales bacterium]
MRKFLPLVAILCTSACSKKPSAEFSKLAAEATYKMLSFSPVNAAGQGLHKFEGVDFDTQLDDNRPQTVRSQRDYLVALHKRMAEFDKAGLSPDDRADYDVLESQLGLYLFDIDIARTRRVSPQSYVELVGNALFTPMMLEYASKEDRFRHIIARMEKLPGFFETARRQLYGAPKIWIEVAKEENQGNISLVDRTLRAAVPESLKPQYETAANTALESLRAFTRFLETDLPERGKAERGGNGPDWRLGAEPYATKFKLALATDRTPDQVLADAENRLKDVRAAMLETSLPLHAKWFATHAAHDDLKGEVRVNKVVREVLDHIAQDHSTPETYFSDAGKYLDEARAFAQSKNLLTLPAGSNLQVIPTPEFFRGIYGVGGFNPAPVLEPKLGAFFWITPIPASWPKERVESKLREYNAYNLRLLVVHEAMPGHYVQAEFANSIEPKDRRVLRSVFSNGPNVEGWAQYITQVMLDEGYMNNAPEMRLTLYKQELRVDANAILDIRLQTKGMTDEQAMDLMEKSTFQEHEEAVAKLQRAKLSSTQLSTYFTGWRDWLRVREHVKANTPNFNQQDFHNKALKAGAVPLPVLAQLLTGKALK